MHLGDMCICIKQHVCKFNYNKPFMITYINTATFSFYLLPYLCNFQKHKNRLTKPLDENAIPETEMSLLNDDNSVDDTFIINEETETVSTTLDTARTMKLSLAFCFLWFLANYTNNASLAYTSVTSSTILSSMSGLFTLIVGALCKVELFSWTKMIAVCISFFGVVLVSYSDNSSAILSSRLPLIGDTLALCGAVFYGCYTVLLKLKIGDESRISMSLFFGFVGVFNLIFMWPFFFALSYSGLEKFELPFSNTIWIMILANAFIGTFLSDYLWLLSMLMTSPLLVTLGASLTIPLAIAGDSIVKYNAPKPAYIVGAILVIAGFVVVNTVTQPKESPSELEEPFESH
ncbi:unnamed protein product [Rhizopus stolonifer]